MALKQEDVLTAKNLADQMKYHISSRGNVTGPMKVQLSKQFSTEECDAWINAFEDFKSKIADSEADELKQKLEAMGYEVKKK